MKKLLITTALVGAAFTAPAVNAATVITGAVSNISYHNSDPGLVIFANPISFPTFSLNNVGDFQDFKVLTIGTTEGTVNTNFLSLFGEDTVPYPISVNFTFSSPAGTLGSPVSGSTSGFIAPFTSCGVIAGGCGEVAWGGPSIFNFGKGGQFSVSLSNATFGTPGSADVTGRFTLLSQNGAVPEPATWALMILGFGAIGAAMRRSRTTVRVHYSVA